MKNRRKCKIKFLRFAVPYSSILSSTMAVRHGLYTLNPSPLPSMYSVYYVTLWSISFGPPKRSSSVLRITRYFPSPTVCACRKNCGSE